jgi:hypothetical protein
VTGQATTAGDHGRSSTEGGHVFGRSIGPQQHDGLTRATLDRARDIGHDDADRRARTGRQAAQ